MEPADDDGFRVRADGAQRRTVPRLDLLYVNGTHAGGSLMSTRSLAAALAGRGHRVVIVHQRPRGSITRYLYRRATNLEVKRGVRRSGQRLSRVNRYLGARSREDRRCSLEMRACSVPENGARVLLGRSPDVVIVSSVSRVGWRRIREDAARLNIPTVLYLREEALLAHLEVVGRPDLLVANSAALGAASGLTQPAVIVPSIVDLRAAATTSQRRVALLVNPTADYGVEKAAALAAANPQIPFAFQESTPLLRSELARARTIARALPNVELRRFRPSPAEVFRDAKVLLAPYSERLRSNRPRSVLEAASNGIPTLGTDLEGLREAVGSGGVLLSAGSSLSVWSDQLSRLWSDEDRYDTLRVLATARAHQVEREMASAPGDLEAALVHLVRSWGRL